MFSADEDSAETVKDLCWWLECLTQRDQSYIKQHPNTPRLYKSGVIYKRPLQYEGDVEEVKILKAALGREARQKDVKKVLRKIQDVLGGEHFCDIGVILQLGGIDCDGLAAARAAELRQLGGIPASPFMTSRRRLDGGVTYHALVLWPPFGSVPYETTEDPSLLLGMGGAARAADRAEEIRKNQERCEIIRDFKKRNIPLISKPTEPVADLEDILGFRRESREEAEALEDVLKRIRVAA